MSKLVFGFVVPALLAWCGIHACVTREIAYLGRHPMGRFFGLPALFFGLSFVGIGFLVHLYSFEDYYHGQPRWEFGLKTLAYVLLAGGAVLGTAFFLFHLPDQPAYGLKH